MQATTLLIARHGTVFKANEPALLIGAQSDLPLSAVGKAQAKALAKQLKDQNLIPQMIFTSPLIRAVQTAQQINKALKLDIPTEALDIFIDIDYGPDENKSESEVIERIGEDGMKAWDEHSLPPLGWIADPTDLRAAWYDFGERIASEFSGQTVLVITHNGNARFSSILTGDAHGLECAESAKRKLRLEPGAYGHLIHTDAFWRCLEWNVVPE